jgi:outer membrane protein OmpA-like peptidoglycan-associated protein
MSILSNKVRMGTVGITVAAMTLGALPASAAQRVAGVQRPASKQEDIGVLTGTAVGAAAGGPIGAVVGMVAGALLGRHYQRQSAANHTLAAGNLALETRNRVLTASLDRRERENAGLEGKLTEASRSLAAVEAQRTELDRTVQASDDIETNVLFRTGATSINRMQLPALRKIAALAASLPPGAKVRIDGYADPRGPASFNDDLSLLRAEAVALALQSDGCPRNRLVIEGHGSIGSTAARRDLDAYALERRVDVRLEGGPAVAELIRSGPEVADAAAVVPGTRP